RRFLDQSLSHCRRHSSIGTRHPRESGGPGRRYDLRPVESRFRGDDGVNAGEPPHSASRCLDDEKCRQRLEVMMPRIYRPAAVAVVALTLGALALPLAPAKAQVPYLGVDFGNGF